MMPKFRFDTSLVARMPVIKVVTDDLVMSAPNIKDRTDLVVNVFFEDYEYECLLGSIPVPEDLSHEFKRFIRHLEAMLNSKIDKTI